jgi:hypothetical protein
MMVREFKPSDINELKEIHAKYFADEFTLPDFLSGYLCAVTIEDEKGIVTMGGVRNIAEVVAVTNKDRSVRARRIALWNLLHATSYVANAYRHEQLHVFIQESNWLKHLINVGFKPTKGQALVMEI